MEKLYNTSKLLQDKVVKVLTKYIDAENVKKVIDAGSGKISASIALKYFPNAKVDAIIFPGDNRKKHPLENAIGSNRLDIIEQDICITPIKKQYDVCTIVMTLGEAQRFGNYFEDLFHHIMDIKSNYFIFIDVFEDPSVHFRYMEQWFKEKGFKIIKRKKFKNPNPEHYPKVKFDKYKLEFDSKHFLGYMVAKG